MATQAEVAAHLFLDQAVVSRLLAKGVLPAAGRGQLDIDSCRQAYIEHVRASAAGRDSSRPGSLEAERARLAAAQAEAQERKNARERGDYVDFRTVDILMRGTIETVVSRLQRIGATVAAGDLRLRGRIEKAVDDALHELAKMDLGKIVAAQGVILPDQED